MPIKLSSSDLDAAARVMSELLSPLGGGSVDAWRANVNRQLIALLGADSAGFILPVPDAPPVYSEEHDPAALARYPDLAPPPRSNGQPIFERAVELGVSTLRQVWGDDLPMYLRTAYHNDYAAANRAYDSLTAVLGVQENGVHGMAGVQLWHSSPHGKQFGERELALLRLLLPALRTGIEMQLRWHRHRSELPAVLDHLSHPTLLYDPTTGVLHQTPALSRALAEDPHGNDVFESLLAVAREVGLQQLAPCMTHSGLNCRREVSTAYAGYEISGSLFPESASACGFLVMVALRRITPVLRDEDDLRRTYRLTRAEIRVLPHLLSAKSSEEIARDLYLSRHTVRRHTESILSKLDVSSRVELGAKLFR
jgi:DNA-binding CsgD family transcriptional regulator